MYRNWSFICNYMHLCMLYFLERFPSFFVGTYVRIVLSPYTPSLFSLYYMPIIGVILT